MKKILARHRNSKVFDKLGFGLVTEDLGDKCIVYWLKSKYKSLQLKEFMFLLDEQAENGYIE
mgnify:FL=1|tara:strand:+ start:223 stop:408 length:186 start_codon:yes stop_codon:yes gene_type:complete